MYSVSQDYLDKLYSGSIRRRIRGTVDNIAFTEDDILSGSFKYIEKCINSADINLGGVFIGEFDCTFLPSLTSRIQRGSWRGRIVQFTIDLLVDPDNDTWESVPCKPYKIDEATHSKFGVAITAYDYMYSFDSNFNLSTTAGTVYDFAVLACQACGVTLGMTQAQMEALPNGTETLSVWPTNDIDTWRDFISWIAVTIGGFATINRSGELVFRTWHNTADVEIDINDRFTGGSWSDFSTYYTGLSIVNMDTEETQYYNVEPDTGLTMKLGNNPLMQYGTNETKTRQRMAILTALQDFVYVPFNSTSLIDPFLDLGDVVSYTDGLAGEESICCVHSMQFTYSKGMKLIGYGKNPALFGAQSKTDKNIAGLLSKTDENTIVTHTFVNAAQIDLVEDQLTSILKIRFATINAKVIKLLHEIQLDVEITDQSGIGSCTAYYYLDNSLIESYTPTTTWDNDGLHLMNLLYWLQNLEGGQQYTWEVRLKCEGCTATLDRNWVHALLEAQGLVAAESWDGIIEIAEEYAGIFTGGAEFGYEDSGIVFDWKYKDTISITDNYDFSGIGGAVFSYTDSVTAYTENIIYELVDADHTVNVGSSDGSYYIQSSS